MYSDNSDYENCKSSYKTKNGIIKSHCVDVQGEAEASCDNFEANPNILIPDKPIVVKMPIVLSELRIKVPVKAVVTLPENVTEIKRVKKNLKITQCLLLPGDNSYTDEEPDQLFIKGFVRKNIEYAARSASNVHGVCGDINHCTVDIPFKCTTAVTYKRGTKPDLIHAANIRNEFEFFRKEKLNGPEFAEKDELMSGDFSEYNQSSIDFYNELPSFELVSSKIVEYDEYLGRRRPSCAEVPFEEKEFHKIEEKMVVWIDLRILQNRPTLIPPGSEYVSGMVILKCNKLLKEVTIEFERVSGNGPVPPSVKTDEYGIWSQKGFIKGVRYRAIPKKDNIVFSPSFYEFEGKCKDVIFRERQCPNYENEEES